MRSRIVEIIWWQSPLPQREATKCSAHGRQGCSRDLVADVYLADAGSPRIHWTVCQHWLDNEPDVAHYDAGHTWAGGPWGDV